MSKEFNPNDIGIANGNYFGLPYSLEESQLLLYSVPWDVTTSYGGGASHGPQAMLSTSLQVDLFDFDVPDAWSAAIGTIPLDDDLYTTSSKNRDIAEAMISYLEQGGDPEGRKFLQHLKTVNEACQEMVDKVAMETGEWLDKGKIIGLVGGDHSTPLGLLRALAEHHESFGILHIDAHADLREAYEGFTYSHASIMFNALKLQQVQKLVQVGIRDLCQDEFDLAQADSRVVMFNDYDLKAEAFNGKLWHQQCEVIVAQLPQKVYISFDIDGLQPELCPNTGTPVVGGLSFNQAHYLLRMVVKSGKQIIGFDLNEVSPADNDWDANVGARVLYKLCLLTIAASNEKFGTRLKG
jgi:Arginase/agmatinase/formimionoglutamate hydrolase, arginase family